MYCGKLEDIMALNLNEEYDKGLFDNWINEAKTKTPSGEHHFTNIELVLLRTIETLLERNEALAGMLKRLEWNGDNYLPDSRCRICGGNELNGHAPDCMLAKLLEGGK